MWLFYLTDGSTHQTATNCQCDQPIAPSLAFPPEAEGGTYGESGINKAGEGSRKEEVKEKKKGR